MKTCIINQFLLPALIAGLGLIPVGRVTAQTFTTLHNCSGGSDGRHPLAGLILSGNTLYGTAYSRGSPTSNGTVFGVHTDGTGFTILHTFTGTTGPNPSTNSDGSLPQAGLILSGNTLYGTTSSGGGSGNGTVFAVNTDGTGFKTLHNFGGLDGEDSHAGLILSGNTLYGTMYRGGSSGSGTVFAVNTDGTGFTTLYSFTETSGIPSYINSDGASPLAGLILSGITLYGAAGQGGSSGHGTVFAVNTDGTGFTTLYSFTETSGFPTNINSDGAGPTASLILSGNTLYGTTQGGGSSGSGTVFAVNTDGTGITNLHSFTKTIGTWPNASNSDGAYPFAGLILSGNTLFGTAGQGGRSGKGTVFAVNTDGTGFTNLHNFTAVQGPSSTNSDGAYPQAGLILSGNTLFGTAWQGGRSGNGTVFSLSLPPPPHLTTILSGANVIFTWPTDAAGFGLEVSDTLTPTPNWSPESNAPVVIGDQNVVTLEAASSIKFFRLKKP